MLSPESSPEEVVLELELVQANLVRINLKVDSLVVSMRLQSQLVDTMIMILKGTTKIECLETQEVPSSGDMTSINI